MSIWFYCELLKTFEQNRNKEQHILYRLKKLSVGTLYKRFKVKKNNLKEKYLRKDAKQPLVQPLKKTQNLSIPI